MTTILPLVSIGIPVFNGENFLESALDSILAQTYTNLEIIISDNASTDQTQVICERYAARDNRVSYIRNDRNLGAARNYNLTVEIAQGKYFKWAAHDDVCEPTFIERCIEVLEREPAVVLAYPKTIVIDASGKPIDSHFEDLYDIRSAEPHVRFKQFCETPLDCNPVFGVVRLSELRKTPCIGPYESSDRVLLGELAMLGQIWEVPERLFLRRYHKNISTYVHKTKESMAAWFNPNSSGKFTRLRRFVEYVRAICRVPLSLPQRIYCFYCLAEFYARFYWTRIPLKPLVRHIQQKFHTMLPDMQPAIVALKKKEVF